MFNFKWCTEGFNSRYTLLTKSSKYDMFGLTVSHIKFKTPIKLAEVSSDADEIEDGILYYSKEKNKVVFGQSGEVTDTVSSKELDELKEEIDLEISLHLNDNQNPHNVTKDQIGLGNVDNTSDIDKPISTATQTALDLKSDKLNTYTKVEVDDLLDTKQPIDSTLNSLSSYNSNGLMTQTSQDTFTGRSIVGTSPISVTNGNGVSGNPTISHNNSGVVANTYGSSSQIPIITVNSTGHLTNVTNTNIDKLYDHWHGTTQYNASQLRRYTNSGVTDGNGRVTFHLTTNGLSGGTPLFSDVLSVNVIGMDGSGTVTQAPLFFIESITSTQVIIRGIRGTSTSVLLGGTIVSMQYVGSGYSVRITIEGVRA